MQNDEIDIQYLVAVKTKEDKPSEIFEFDDYLKARKFMHELNKLNVSYIFTSTGNWENE